MVALSSPIPSKVCSFCVTHCFNTWRRCFSYSQPLFPMTLFAEVTLWYLGIASWIRIMGERKWSAAKGLTEAFKNENKRHHWEDKVKGLTLCYKELEGKKDKRGQRLSALKRWRIPQQHLHSLSLHLVGKTAPHSCGSYITQHFKNVKHTAWTVHKALVPARTKITAQLVWLKYHFRIRVSAA